MKKSSMLYVGASMLAIVSAGSFICGGLLVAFPSLEMLLHAPARILKAALVLPIAIPTAILAMQCFLKADKTQKEGY